MSGIFEANRATGITPITHTETLARRWFERIVALAALVLAAPICVAIAVAVRSEDGGPVLFRQRRMGLGGEPFELLKFRSMSVGAAGAAVTAAGDRRVTRTGRWLRKFKLDELPQLWNVARGEMSLVGPRPEVERYVDLEQAVWRRVLAVRPGITDAATLIYRDEERILAGFADPEAGYRETVLPDKLKLNLAYLERRTLWTDAQVVAWTACYSLLPAAFDAARLRKRILS